MCARRLTSVEIVNFANPYRPDRITPGRDAIRNARPIDASSPLRCVELADLIALKLFSGSLRDKADVAELMQRNPDADLAAIRNVCARYALTDALDEVLRAS